ncbi:MAG: terminase family protein [Planctomycetota bacterium]
MSGTLNQIVPWAIPRTPDRLHAFLGEVFAIDVPRTAITEGASSPFDYLVHAFFEPGMRDEEGPEEENQTTGDCVVWASRGSGKTFYSAIATALDLIFKPGVEVRVLGGSLEQASRMYEHLRDVFDQDDLAPLVDGRITERKLQLVNGSRVALLAASQTSVRGVRPNILRCDEVDLFDPDVWRAATLTTRSAKCGDVLVRGRIEALSTWHLAGGMMSRLVPNAQLEGRKSFRW